MASKKINKKDVSKKDINNTFDSVVTKAKEVTHVANDFALDSADDMVKTAFHRAAEWQVIGEKTLQGGLKLAANQQDLFFDTLDVFKAQLIKSQDRFSSLFSKN